MLSAAPESSGPCRACSPARGHLFPHLPLCHHPCVPAPTPGPARGPGARAEEPHPPPALAQSLLPGLSVLESLLLGSWAQAAPGLPAPLRRLRCHFRAHLAPCPNYMGQVPPSLRPPCARQHREWRRNATDLYAQRRWSSLPAGHPARSPSLRDTDMCQAGHTPGTPRGLLFLGPPGLRAVSEPPGTQGAA